MTFKTPSSTIIALTTTLLAIILSSVAVIFSSYVNQELLAQPTLTTPALSASDDEKLTYCQKWASQEAISTPNCQGEWILTDFTNGTCDWECKEISPSIE